MNYEEEFALYKHISKMADAYVPLETILEKNGATLESACQEAQQYKSDFFAELESLAIPSDDLTTVCMEIVRRIEEHPDDEQLQRLYCQLITDAGLFYSLWERDMEQIIRNYYRQKEQSERLVQEIQKAISMKDRLQILRQEARKRISKASEYPEEEEMIHRLSLQYSFLYKGRKNTAYAENIRILVRMVNSKPVLRQVKPYLIATVLSRKHSMILTHPDYVPNLENVLKFKLYNIHKDNGKNFDTYQSYVELYEHLRRYYEADGTVDMDFSDFCFASLSNLSEWYYLYCEPNEGIPMNLMRKVKTLKAPMFPMLSEDGEQGDLEMELEDRLIYAASIWMPEQIEE